MIRLPVCCLMFAAVLVCCLMFAAVPALAGDDAPDVPVPVDPVASVDVQVGPQSLSDIVRYETRTRTVRRPETYTEMVPVTRTRWVDVEEEYQVGIREVVVQLAEQAAQPATVGPICPPCDAATSVNVSATGPGVNVDVQRRKGLFQKLRERRMNRSFGTSVNVRL